MKLPTAWRIFPVASDAESFAPSAVSAPGADAELIAREVFGVVSVDNTLHLEG